LGAHDGAPLSGAAPLHERPLTSPVTHTRERPSVRSSVRVRRGPSLPPPRQRRLLVTTRDAFHRQVLPELVLSPEPMPGIGWEPVTVPLALPRGSRLPGPIRQPLLSRRMARQRSWSARSSRVGERCRAPPVDFCNRNDPRARPRNVRAPQHHTRSRPLVQLFSRGCALADTPWAADGLSRSRELASRGFTGQGSLAARRCRPRCDLSHRDRSREELCPDPIDSSTSCREP
jgi:hypothetical protein